MTSTNSVPTTRFIIQWGSEKLSFSEVTGLDVPLSAGSVRGGGGTAGKAKTKLPGLPKSGSITMKRGTFRNGTGYDSWMKKVGLNKDQHGDLTITVLNEKQEPLITWRIVNPVPLSVQAARLKTDANEVAIESLELSHEGLQIVEQA